MANERWERLAEQQGVADAKTVAEAMKLKRDMDNPADREKLRRAILDLVAGRKVRKQKGMRWQIGRNGDGEHFTLIAYGSNPSRLFGMYRSAVSITGSQPYAEIDLGLVVRHSLGDATE